MDGVVPFSLIEEICSCRAQVDNLWTAIPLQHKSNRNLKSRLRLRGGHYCKHFFTCKVSEECRSLITSPFDVAIPGDCLFPKNCPFPNWPSLDPSTNKVASLAKDVIASEQLRRGLHLSPVLCTPCSRMHLTLPHLHRLCSGLPRNRSCTRHRAAPRWLAAHMSRTPRIFHHLKSLWSSVPANKPTYVM